MATIKPLVWSDETFAFARKSLCLESLTPLGLVINRNEDEERCWLRKNGQLVGYFDSIDDAKAAAQTLWGQYLSTFLDGLKKCDHCQGDLIPEADGDVCIPCNKKYIRLVRRPGAYVLTKEQQ